MLSVISPSPKYGLFFPPQGHESEYEGALCSWVATSGVLTSVSLPGKLVV